MRASIQLAILVLVSSTCFADSNNPYYAPSKLSGAIEGFLSGMKDSNDRAMAAERAESENALRRQQIEEMKANTQRIRDETARYKAETDRIKAETERLTGIRNQLLVRISPTTEPLLMPDGEELSPLGRAIMPPDLLGDVPQFFLSKDGKTQVPNPRYEEKQAIVQKFKEAGTLQIPASPLTASEVLFYRMQGDPVINAAIEIHQSQNK